MPKPSEDKYFGGKKGAARKAYVNIVSHYGLSKGEEVYYGVLNRNKARMRRGSKSGT